MLKIERQSTTHAATESLRQAIISGDLKMGTPLQEEALTRQLGVSRTPIREALFRLQSEGLVTIRPYRGASVFTVTKTELEDMIDFREVIELAAVRKALASNADALVEGVAQVMTEMAVALEQQDTRAYLLLDHRLHSAIVDASDSAHLVDAYRMIAFKMTALRTALGQTRERILASFDAHLELQRLINAGNANGACKMLRRHVQDGKILFSTGPGVLLNETDTSEQA